ncbi:histidine-type phosphatase [Dyella caseinilytica]|uniref:Histidine-type phosphatase n=1 Tax=Dyella caseinilytica TaxID=1849581 RepID=A0ABX7GWR8_9GAMM|nr:histidine-type phosphatase [Dyella caseinilytica]QRN53645.1 histidine-type phosphatase [Dyella caseinilytica]
MTFCLRLPQLLCALAVLLGCCSAAAGEQPEQSDLQWVLVLSRHGVRSPTAQPGALDAFATKPWPAWPVPPGYLTPHGKQLMRIMGAWYRDYYANAGLLPIQGCLPNNTLFVLADDEQRTLESARGLMMGFEPGCDVDIRASPKKGPQALFAHDFSQATDEDRALAAAAVLGRIGGDPSRLALANASSLELMQQTLFGCQPTACDPSLVKDRKWLKNQASSISPAQDDGLLSIKSPLHNASTFAENFYLEYTEGMPMSDVAWGRITPAQLGQLIALHSLYSDISLRTPEVASAYASDLAEGILATLQQAAGADISNKAIGPAKAKIVFLVGHDTNIETLAGMLDLHWLLPEQPADPTSPGGALVFELRHRKQSGQYVVRAYYVAQSMDQMRNTTTLDRAHPPSMAPIFIPGCSDASAGYDCPLDRLSDLVQQRSGLTKSH